MHIQSFEFVLSNFSQSQIKMRVCVWVCWGSAAPLSEESAKSRAMQGVYQYVKCVDHT